MFCQKCGNQIDNSSDFCPKCGSPQNPQQYTQNRTSSVQQRQQIRQDEIAELDRMIEYFSVKQNQYDEYDSVCERLNPNFIKVRKIFIILGIITGFYSILFFAQKYVFVGIILFLVTAVLLFAFIKNILNKKNNFATASKRYYELSEELYQYYLNYGPCLVSAEYSNPTNLIAIKQTIQSGRADTIADSLNILLDDEHKAAMEAYSAQTAASAQNAARSAGEAANNSAVSAIFSAANFFYNVQKDRSNY